MQQPENIPARLAPIAEAALTNMNGAGARPEAVYTWEKIQAAMDNTEDAAPDTDPVMGSETVYWFLAFWVVLLAQPFRFFLLKRVQDEYEQLNESDRNEVMELLERCDMLPVMETKLTREIGRDNNLEVWR